MSDHSQLHNCSCSKVPQVDHLAGEALKFQLLGEGNDNCVVSIIGTGLVIRIKKVNANKAHKLCEPVAQQDGHGGTSSNFDQTESSIFQPPSCCLPSFKSSTDHHQVHQVGKDGEVIKGKICSTSLHTSISFCSAFEHNTRHIACNQFCSSGCPKCSLIHQCCRDLAFLNHIAYSLFGPALVKPGKLVCLSPKTLTSIQKLLQHTREEGRLHKTINPYGIAILCPDASTLFHGCHECSSLQSPSICSATSSINSQVPLHVSPFNGCKVPEMITSKEEKKLKKSLQVLTSEADWLHHLTRKKQRTSRSVCKPEQCVATPQGAKHWKVSAPSSSFSDEATHLSSDRLPVCGLRTSSVPYEWNFMSWSEHYEETASSHRHRVPPKPFNAVSRSLPSHGKASLNSVYLTESAIEAKKKKEKLKIQTFLSQVILDKCCAACGRDKICACPEEMGCSLGISTSPLSSIDYLNGLKCESKINSKVFLKACDDKHLEDRRDFQSRTNFMKDEQRLQNHLSKTDSLFFDSRLKHSASFKTENSGKKPNVSYRKPVTLCVELKPKQGFLEPVKDPSMQLCRFCLKQFIKCSKGGSQVHSNYCPLDLFSGHLGRMSGAVSQLFAAPQNNLRIFKDGAIVDTIAPYSYLSEVLPYVLLSRPYGDPLAARTTVASGPQHLGTKSFVPSVSPASRSTSPTQATRDPVSVPRFLRSFSEALQNDPFAPSLPYGADCDSNVVSGSSTENGASDRNGNGSPSHAFGSCQCLSATQSASASPTNSRSPSPSDAQSPSASIEPALFGNSFYGLDSSSASTSYLFSQTMERLRSANGAANPNEIRNISFTSCSKIPRDDSGNSSDSGTDNEFSFVDGGENIVASYVPTISSKLSSDSLLSSVSDCSYSLKRSVEFLNSDSSSEATSVDDVELHSSSKSPAFDGEPDEKPTESQDTGTHFFSNNGCKNDSEGVINPSHIEVDIDETLASLGNDSVGGYKVPNNSINLDLERLKCSLQASRQEKNTPLLHSGSPFEPNQNGNCGLPFDSVLGKVYNSQLSELSVVDAYEAFERLTELVGEDEAYKRLWVIPDSQGNDMCQMIYKTGCVSLQSCLEEWDARTNDHDFDGIFCESSGVDDGQKLSANLPERAARAAHHMRSDVIGGFVPCNNQRLPLASRECERKQQIHLKDEKPQEYYSHPVNNFMCREAIDSLNLVNHENSSDLMADSGQKMNKCNNSCNCHVTCLHCRGLKPKPSRCMDDPRNPCVRRCKFDACPSPPLAIMPNLKCCDSFYFVNVGGRLNKSALLDSSVSPCKLFCESLNLKRNVESHALTCNQSGCVEALPENNRAEIFRRCSSKDSLKKPSSPFICPSEMRRKAATPRASLRSCVEGCDRDRDEEITSLVAQIQEFLEGLTFKDCSLMILLSGPHHEATMDEALCRDSPRGCTALDHFAAATERCEPGSPCRKTRIGSNCSSFSPSKRSPPTFKKSAFCTYEDSSLPSAVAPSSQSPSSKLPALQSQLRSRVSPVVSCPFSPSSCPFWVNTPAGWYLCQVTVIDLVSKDPRKVKHHFKAVQELTQLVLRKRQHGEPLPECCALPGSDV